MAWIVKVLKARAVDRQRVSQEHLSDLQRQLTVVEQQKDRLLNLRLLDEVDDKTFAAKQTEFRDREATLTLEIEANGRRQPEYAGLATKAFELSQTITRKWLNADTSQKRQLLDILCLNWTLDGVTLVPTMRKPFDLIVKGLVATETRGDRI